jgi:hypothetical protein
MLFETEQQVTEQQVVSPKDKVPHHEEPLKKIGAILSDVEDMS